MSSKSFAAYQASYDNRNKEEVTKKRNIIHISVSNEYESLSYILL